MQTVIQFSRDHRWVLIIATAFVSILLLTAGNYGFFRDELYYIANAEHLDIGYVEHPPMVAWITGLSMLLFGDSLLGLRLWPALAGGATIVLTALLTARLGGGRWAQRCAALAVAMTTAFGVLFGYMSMNAFDILLVTLFFLLLMDHLLEPTLKSWGVLGSIAGLALLTKITMGVVGIGLLTGLAVTPYRREFRKPGLWLMGVIAAVLFAPFIVWQAANGFPMLEFIRNAQEYKNVSLNPVEFFGQLFLALNPALAPLWLGGLLYLLLPMRTPRVRVLGVTALATLTLFMLQNSKFYYVTPIVPLLLAAGCVGLEPLLKRGILIYGRIAVPVIILTSGLLLLPMAVPVLPVQQFVKYSDAIGLLENVQSEQHERVALPQHFADRFGWQEMAASVAGVYNSLPRNEQEKVVILAGNYGEAGAISLFGDAFGLPDAISTHNSYYFWGPGEKPGEILIAIGVSEEILKQYFDSVETAAYHSAEWVMAYENNLPIYICREPKSTLQEVWTNIRNFI